MKLSLQQAQYVAEQVKRQLIIDLCTERDRPVLYGEFRFAVPQNQYLYVGYSIIKRKLPKAGMRSALHDARGEKLYLDLEMLDPAFETEKKQSDQKVEFHVDLCPRCKNFPVYNVCEECRGE